MQLETYFDVLAPGDIRIRGTRVGIESVLYAYIHQDLRPEAIAEQLPTVTLEQIYATILYYLRNRHELDAYLASWLALSRAARDAQQRRPSPAVVRLLQRKAEQQAVALGR